MGFWVQTLPFLLGFLVILWIHWTQGLLHAKCILSTTELQSGSHLTHELQSLLYKPQVTSWRILGRIKWMKELKLHGIQKRFKRGYATLSFIWKWLKKKVRKRKINALITWKCTDQHLLVKKKCLAGILPDQWILCKREVGRYWGTFCWQMRLWIPLMVQKIWNCLKLFKKKSNSQETPWVLGTPLPAWEPFPSRQFSPKTYLASSSPHAS